MYLDDLILAISRISEYTKVHTLESFIEDYKTIDAVARNFEVIGEAARKITAIFLTICQVLYVIYLIIINFPHYF